MSDPFWPEGYADPAFQIQRQQFGTVFGGDYVRGSAQFKGVLSGTGTALPAGVEGDMWLVGSPIPTAVPNPTPGTKAVGNVIRYQSGAWVNRGSITQTVSTAVRYQSTAATSFDTIGGRSILHTYPVNRSTVEIVWGWPSAPNDQWTEVSLVRSAFGRPSTVNDGQTIYRQPNTLFTNPDYPSANGRAKPLVEPPVLQDGNLPAGRWYHYAMFFNMGHGEWVRGMVDTCLLPQNWLHAEHLWDNVPPYYRWVDSQFAQQQGFLQQFLQVFGFELDQTREFVESWQHLYDVDWSPIRLLRHLGPNFGIDYEAGLGDIRFRALMADIGYLFKIRGTQPGLKLLVERMSKYQCAVTAGTSMLLTPDDSDFYQSTGSWAGLHPDTAVTPTSIRLNGTAGTHVEAPDMPKIVGATTFVVEVDVAADSWSAAGVLAAQTATGAGNGSWILTLTGTGAVGVSVYPDGSSPLNYTSGVLGLAAASRHKIKAIWTAVAGANSTVQFQVDGVNSGAALTAATVPGGLYNSPLPVRLGNNGNDNTRFTGNVYGATITANSVLIASPDFTAMDKGTSSVDAQGNVWTLQGAATVTNSVTVLPPEKVFLDKTNVVTASKGRGVMRVWTAAADAAAQLAINVGDGIRYPGNDANVNNRLEILPKQYGIPVHPGVSYGFSFSVSTATSPLTPEPYLLFFDKNGVPGAPLTVVTSTNPLGINDLLWHDYYIQGKAPATATLMVPGIRFSSRPAAGPTFSPDIYICGVMVYVAGDVGTVLAVPPDRYLTVGDPSEKLGIAKAGFDPFLIGTPRSR